MSNLGPYQDIVTSAKAAGGVPSLVRTIEEKAVSLAAPGIYAKGLGSGLLISVAAAAAGLAGKRYWDRRKSDFQIAVEAKEQLVAELDSSSDEGSDTAACGDLSPQLATDHVRGPATSARSETP